MEFPDSVRLEPGQAEIRIELMNRGGTRFIVRGPDGIFFDWIMENEERQSVIQHMLLPDEMVVKKKWWHRFWRQDTSVPLITALER